MTYYETIHSYAISTRRYIENLGSKALNHMKQIDDDVSRVAGKGFKVLAALFGVWANPFTFTGFFIIGMLREKPVLEGLEIIWNRLGGTTWKVATCSLILGVLLLPTSSLTFSCIAGAYFGATFKPFEDDMPQTAAADATD